MERDQRDPTALGKALLGIRQATPKRKLSEVMDKSRFRIPDYKEEDVQDRYSR